MTKRTKKAYRKVLKYIEENIFQLKPAKMMTDFEKALRKAIKQTYQNVALHGCWFHFDQAIVRLVLITLFNFYKEKINCFLDKF